MSEATIEMLGGLAALYGFTMLAGAPGGRAFALPGDEAVWGRERGGKCAGLRCGNGRGHVNQGRVGTWRSSRKSRSVPNPMIVSSAVGAAMHDADFQRHFFKKFSSFRHLFVIAPLHTCRLSQPRCMDGVMYGIFGPIAQL